MKREPSNKEEMARSSPNGCNREMTHPLTPSLAIVEIKATNVKDDEAGLVNFIHSVPRSFQPSFCPSKSFPPFSTFRSLFPPGLYGTTHDHSFFPPRQQVETSSEMEECFKRRRSMSNGDGVYVAHFRILRIPPSLLKGEGQLKTNSSAQGHVG